MVCVANAEWLIERATELSSAHDSEGAKPMLPLGQTTRINLSALTRKLLLLCAALLFGCGQLRMPRTDAIVLAYAEFGPQAMAFETIGMQWFQWQSHGSDDPKIVDEINVVVYRDVSLAQIKARYPVINGKQDFRYLDYASALAFFDAKWVELDVLDSEFKSLSSTLGGTVLPSLP